MWNVVPRCQSNISLNWQKLLFRVDDLLNIFAEHSFRVTVLTGNLLYILHYEKYFLLRHHIHLWYSLAKNSTWLVSTSASTLASTVFLVCVHHLGINYIFILSLSLMATVGQAEEWGRDDYHRSGRYKISYCTWLLWTGRGGETIYLAAFPNQLLRVCLSHFGLCVLQH